MANEENNNQNGDQNTDNLEGKENGSGNFSLTTDKFNEFADKELGPKIDAAASKGKVKLTVFGQKETLKNYKLCSLIQTEAAHDEYSNIMNCIMTVLAESVGEIQSNIESYISYETQMEEALTTSIQAVKEVKTKLSAVNDAACKLENAMKDSCNSEQLRELVNGIQESEDGEEKKFKDAVEEIQGQVDAAKDAGYKAFETGIKVAGIAKFTNLQSLKAFGGNLQTGVEQLSGDILDNIDFSATKKTEIQEELTAIMKERINAKFEKFKALLEQKALESTEAYAEAPDVPEDEEGSPVTLEAICEKVESSFGACNE